MLEIGLERRLERGEGCGRVCVYLWKDVEEDAETPGGGVMQLSDGLGVDHHHRGSHAATTAMATRGEKEWGGE